MPHHRQNGLSQRTGKRARQFLSPQTSRALPGVPGGGDSDDETDGYFVQDSGEFKLDAADQRLQ
jgi:hypothetical protein